MHRTVRAHRSMIDVSAVDASSVLCRARRARSRESRADASNALNDDDDDDDDDDAAVVDVVVIVDDVDGVRRSVLCASSVGDALSLIDNGSGIALTMAASTLQQYIARELFIIKHNVIEN